MTDKHITPCSATQARRFYMHVKTGGKLTALDVERMLMAIELAEKPTSTLAQQNTAYGVNPLDAICAEMLAVLGAWKAHDSTHYLDLKHRAAAERGLRRKRDKAIAGVKRAVAGG